MDIYLRPLSLEDAKTSYKWRNDPEIWKYTDNRPDRKITQRTEESWLTKVSDRKDSARFAICIKNTDKYIGNVQLTSINNQTAEFHIFIGNKKYWGKKIAQKASRLILVYAKHQLHLKSVYLSVNLKNKTAISAYEKVGFTFSAIIEGQMIIDL